MIEWFLVSPEDDIQKGDVLYRLGASWRVRRAWRRQGDYTLVVTRKVEVKNG